MASEEEEEENKCHRFPPVSVHASANDLSEFAHFMRSLYAQWKATSVCPSARFISETTTTDFDEVGRQE
jgi:hypothetical protein